MTEKITEVTDNERTGNESDSGSGEGTGTGYTVNADGTIDSRREPESSGNSAGEQGRSAGVGEGSKRDKEGSKRKLLESIRAKRDERNAQTPIGEHLDVKDELQGIGGRNDNDQPTDAGQLGAGAGADSRPADGEGIAADGDGNTDHSSESSQTSRGRKQQVKPTVGGVKAPSLPNSSKNPVTQVPRLEELLTPKESKELLPKVSDALETIFKNSDKFIGFTTKSESAKEVYIWASIDKSEITVIATSLVETGQRSQIAATLVRKVARDYTKLQLGIILLPRFLMTVQHYLSNGFANPFAGLGGKG